MKIPQHEDPEDFHFELIVPGATPADLERGIQAAWDYFSFANMDPVAAAQAASQVERWREGDPPIENLHLAGAWNNARCRAIDACCQGWPSIPERWKFSLLKRDAWEPSHRKRSDTQSSLYD